MIPKSQMIFDNCFSHLINYSPSENKRMKGCRGIEEGGEGRGGGEAKGPALLPFVFWQNKTRVGGRENRICV